MTVCLYTRPKNIPLLLSDTLLTWEGDDLEAKNLPGSLVQRSELSSFSATQIYRKLYLFGNNIAIACAGEVRAIEDFLTEAKDITASDCSRPLDEHYKILSKYEDHLHALICYEDGHKNGLIAPAGTRHTAYSLFDFHTIGSGDDDVARSLKLDFAMHDITRWSSLTPYEVVANIAGRICSRTIGNELLFGYGKDWGGFSEWALFDRDARKWTYSLPSLQCFVLAIPLPRGRFTLEQSRYFYCYNNDTKLGYSSVLGMRLWDTAYLHQWTLENILSPEPIKERTFADWIGWEPNEIVIQIFPYGCVELGPLFVTTCQFPNLCFKIQNNGIEATIAQAQIDDWGESAAKHWQRQYVPMTSLNHTQMHNAFEAALNGGWRN